MTYYFTELKPCLYNQKSYYNKAKIKHMGHCIKLYSYDTPMVAVLASEIIYLNKNPENYTQTTLKHVKDFLYQTLGVTDLTKKEILKMAKEN